MSRTWISQAAKAFYGAAVASLTGLGAVLVGDVGLTDLSAGQWVTIALGALVAFGAVYRLGPDVQPPGGTG